MLDEIARIILIPGRVIKLDYMSHPVFFLIRSWNCFPYISRCLRSVLDQKVKDFTILFVDDASDYTREQKKYIHETLRGHVAVFNTVRKYAARNAYELIHAYVKQDDAIVINVDGDDWLEGVDVISVIRTIYKKTDCVLTYGNCRYYNPGSPIHNTIASSCGQLNHRYAKDIEHNNVYRKTFFIPLHLRTWKAGLFKKIKKESFLRPNGSWTRSCEDQAMFFPMLEMARGRYEVLKEILYVYNKENVYNDEKTNRQDLLFDELCIYKKPPYDPLV